MPNFFFLHLALASAEAKKAYPVDPWLKLEFELPLGWGDVLVPKYDDAEYKLRNLDKLARVSASQASYFRAEKFLWDIRQEAFRTTCRQLFFFSPQNPNNKMRELGTSGPATIINLVCGLFWCVHYACLGRSTKREREWTSKGVVFRMCHKMSKNAFRTLFSVCQVENLLEFYFS